MDRAKISVSIVIPVKNDERALVELLHLIDVQTRKPDEVVLVVTKSADNTLAVAKKWRPAKTRVLVISEQAANRSQARNIGVQRAHGEVVVFTDAGCLPDPHWLENIVEPFRGKKINLVSGYTAGYWINAIEEAQVPFVLVPLEQVETQPLPATRNMAVRRNVFLEAGGFRNDLEFAEDFEFARRLRSRGVKAVFVSQARVSWRPRPSLSAFFLMIARLTTGDSLAGIIRPGLVSMWVRYLFFIMLAAIAPLAALIAYGAYLLFKLSKFHFHQAGAYLYAIIAQVVCDAAVLVGSLLGAYKRIFLAIGPRKRDNTTNVD